MTENDDDREKFRAAIGADTSEQTSQTAATVNAGAPVTAPVDEPATASGEPFTSVEVDLNTMVPKTGITPTAAPLKSELPVYAAQRLPARLGRYTLTKRLGAGGMAEIFLATQGGLGSFKKVLVIKRMHPHLAEDERYVDMFLREAQIVADLNHTNIVQIHELGEEGGNVFIAMEFVDGLSLYQVARRSWKAGVSLPMELAVYAIADAALGLHHAYICLGDDGKPRNLVHRDISPDNLMINRQGLTKILDFGIAKGRESLNLTKTGEIKGKLPYLPPEYFLGQPFDHAGDLYALGATLYWMLTGQRPFSGDTDLLLMRAVTEKAPTPPSKLNAAIPPFIEDLILKLLAKDPNERPASGAKLAEQLLGYVPAERSKVAAFVVRMMASPEARGHQPISTDGFLPASPVFDQLSSSGPNRISATADTEVPWSDALATDLGPVSATPSEISMVSLDGTLDLDPDLVDLDAEPPAPPRKRWAAALAIAAVLFGSLMIVSVLLDTEDPLEPPVVTADPVKPLELDAPPVDPPPVEPVDPPPGDPPKVDDPPVVAVVEDQPKPITRRRKPRAAPAMKAIHVKGPSSVRWLDASGKRLGTGSGELKIPASTKTLVAHDTRRAVRTTVPVSSNIDYATLPKGSLAVLAFPYARVFAGKDALGQTPFIPPVKLVAGKYTLKLKHEDKTKTATVTVSPGKTAKLKIDMTK